MKIRIFLGTLMGLLFAAFTYKVKTYDVRAIGPLDSTVGFSHINERVHALTGVNKMWYDITDMLGYAAIALAAVFALIGLVQLIRRRSLRLVDPEILMLGLLFIAVIGFYAGFEKFVINYRPILMPDDLSLEASYPSSHTMLICVVLGAVMILLGRYVRNTALRILLGLVLAAGIIVTVAGRLWCGYHWFTDIVGGLLLSASLLFIFAGGVYGVKDRKPGAIGRYKPKH